MEPAHSETGDCRVEPPASILVARLSMSHLVPLLQFNRRGLSRSGSRRAFRSPSRFIFGWRRANRSFIRTTRLIRTTRQMYVVQLNRAFLEIPAWYIVRAYVGIDVAHAHAFGINLEEQDVELVNFGGSVWLDHCSSLSHHLNGSLE
jgi:hypothetical protein